jgi:hypothetical protein
MKDISTLNFERALARGHRCYDAGVGKWWETRSSDGPHRRAYPGKV